MVTLYITEFITEIITRDGSFNLESHELSRYCNKHIF